MSKDMTLAAVLNSTTDEYRIARLYAQRSRELGLDEAFLQQGPADAYEQLQVTLSVHDSMPRAHTDLLISLLQCKRAMDDVEFRRLMQAKEDALQAKSEALERENNALRLQMVAEREAYQLKMAAERQAEKLTQEKKTVTADYLRAQGKLHMRGLLEYAETELAKDKEVGAVMRVRSKEQSLSKTRDKTMPAGISRMERWQIALEMAQYGSFLDKMQAACGDNHHQSAADFAAAIAQLYRTLNSHVHRVLRDEILDPSNPTGTHVVVDADSVGVLNARLLECIAEQFNIPCIVYKRD